MTRHRALLGALWHCLLPIVFAYHDAKMWYSKGAYRVCADGPKKWLGKEQLPGAVCPRTPEDFVDGERNYIGLQTKREDVIACFTVGLEY